MSKALLCLSLIVFGCVTHAAAQTFFYQGKTITIITGSQAGDLFDIYARMMATHMGKNIPGNPNIWVQNMTAHVISLPRISFILSPSPTA
jgi:tripartite-type tricarboxylate transporter receptor subunit TctC